MNLREYHVNTKRTLILRGYHVSLTVNNRTLVIRDGSSNHEDHNLYELQPGCRDFTSIIILSTSGDVTFRALQWLAELGIAVLIVGYDGAIISSMLPPLSANAVLRRRQYLLSDARKLAIVKRLLTLKTGAQIDTLKETNRKSSLAPLYAGIDQIQREDSIDKLRTIEGGLASCYFDALASIKLHFREKSIPDCWKTIGKRESPLGNGTARHATSPYHALCNYAIAVCENQLKIQCLAHGLDTTCGYLHTDQTGRDSLLYDLIEPYRAEIDREVLRYCAAHEFSTNEVFLSRKGEILFSPDLLKSFIASLIFPHTEYIATWFVGELERDE